MIFPNETRARIARAELGFSDDRLNIVRNMPRRAELPLCQNRPDEPFLLYFHGSISPVRLPEAIVEAVRQFGSRVRLLIAGYEAPGTPGYIRQLLQLAGQARIHRFAIWDRLTDATARRCGASACRSGHCSGGERRLQHPLYGRRLE